jgi:hypothetical protein
MSFIRFLRNAKGSLIIQVAIIPAFIVSAAAQGGSRRATPADTRRAINNETYRELMNREREGVGSSKTTPDVTQAGILKQLRLDFKGIQDVNNKMMAEAWAQQTVDYGHISEMISDINEKANRLKDNLLLPEVDKTKKKEAVVVSGTKEFRSALMRMDHSIMNFVTNPIFQKANVIEIQLATQASQDLEDVIALSNNLKKISASLKTATISNH